jgi:hypothetical protein
MGLFSRKTASPTPITPDTIQDHAPELVSLVKAAGVSLTKRGLNTEHADVYLVLDHSGSMDDHYAAGDVQHLAEQSLGLAANLDDDGTVPVVFFQSRAYDPMEVRIGSHRGAVDNLRRTGGITWGGTRYAPAMRKVMDAHRGSTTPAFVIFQTDGACTDAADTQLVLREASNLPIFWQFIGFGPQESGEFAFLRGLDTMRGRTVDNAGFFAVGRNPRRMTDADLYDRLLAEYPTWLAAARAAGIVR